jgi:hypothetical protein
VRFRIRFCAYARVCVRGCVYARRTKKMRYYRPVEGVVAAMLEGVPLRNSRRLSAFTRTKMAALAAARLVSEPTNEARGRAAATSGPGSPLPQLHRD